VPLVRLYRCLTTDYDHRTSPFLTFHNNLVNLARAMGDHTVL